MQLSLTVLLAIVVPLTFLYVMHWLDLYGSDRPRVIVGCLAWGLVAFLLSFLANRFCIDILGLSRPFVSTRTAPFVEELFKSGVLVYLVRRGRLTYFVDGAIYGFASGIGFAIIENLRYVQLFPDNPVALVVIRDFSSALAHGTATAMTGIALGHFALRDRAHGRGRGIVFGLIAAMSLHYAWNIFANFSPFSRTTTEWILVSIGLAGVAMVGAAILVGLRFEARRLRASLGETPGVSVGEANLIQHMSDLEHMLRPVRDRFGARKCHDVSALLHLEAQLGLAEDACERAADPGARAEIAGRVAQLERAVASGRDKVGMYVMLYVRSIFPDTQWSLWMRLAQSVAHHPAIGVDVWACARVPATIGRDAGPDMYARVGRALQLRTTLPSAQRGGPHELPDALRHCLHWVASEVTVTTHRVAERFGHEHHVAHHMLEELVARGHLHRTMRNGETSFEPARATGHRLHLWHSAPHEPVAHR